MAVKALKPKRMHIYVVENNKVTADVRIPYGMFKLGMKYGQKAAKDDTDACAMAMARLTDFDCAAFERAVASGEILLPSILLDADIPDDNTHVTITAE